MVGDSFSPCYADDQAMSPVILTSSFQTVASELWQKAYLPHHQVTVAFIPTASDPYVERPWLDADRAALIALGYRVVDVDLKGKHAEDLLQILGHVQIVFIAGGHTTYLLDQVHRSGLDQLIPELLAQGCLYIGSSAGSIIAGPSIEPFLEGDLIDLPAGTVLDNARGLGLVEYLVLPHEPAYAAVNDRVFERYRDRFLFVRLRDDEYRVEHVSKL